MVLSTAAMKSELESTLTRFAVDFAKVYNVLVEMEKIEPFHIEIMPLQRGLSGAREQQDGNQQYLQVLRLSARMDGLYAEGLPKDYPGLGLHNPETETRLIGKPREIPVQPLHLCQLVTKTADAIHDIALDPSSSGIEPDVRIDIELFYGDYMSSPEIIIE